ncbi:MAG: sigma-70 family RNA polymerase sigma factor [Chitinophagaceae bacterium]
MKDEEDLIRSALAGESQAFGILVERYQDRLFTAMISIVGSSDEAEDVVQEAFIQAYIKLNTFQMNSRFFTWLYRIAFNYALSRRRKNRNQVSLDQSREATGNDPMDQREGPDASMQREESVVQVRIAMDRLTEDHRTILVLREMQGMSYEHIAEILEVEIGTVRSRLNRARSQLKSTLEQFPDWK